MIRGLAIELIALIVILFLGDVIKTTLGKARENNKVNCSKAMVYALILKFQEIQKVQNSGQIDRQTVEFHSLKELAKRYGQMQGSA